MITLLIAAGALFLAVIGCEMLDPAHHTASSQATLPSPSRW
jgi:hypothetical protein